MTSEEFRAVYGIDPPPGATNDTTATTPAQAPPSAASAPLVADRPATPEERRAILGDPSPVIPKPPAKPILNTAFANTGATAHGGQPEPWEIGLDAPTPAYMQSAVDAVTGNTAVEHPEIGSLSIPGLGIGPGKDAGFVSRAAANVTDPRALKIIGESMLSRDPAALESVIKRNVPDAKFSTDSQGNRMVQVGDNPPMYLDRPGMTAQKALFYGPQAAVALASRAKSIPGMIGANLAQEGASNVGSYALGGAPGLVDPVALTSNAAITGALGVLGKGLVAGGRAVANWAGDTADSVGTAARRLLAKEFNHEPTLGQVSGDPYQLKKEDLLLNAKAAPEEGRRLVDLHNTNQEATNAAKTGLIAEASGATPLMPGKPPVTPAGFQGDESTFGTKILDNVRTRYEALNDAEKTAWDKLGPLSPNTPGGRAVSFPDATSADITARAYKEVSDGLGLPSGPNGTYSAVDLRNGGQSVVDALNVITDKTMGATTTGAPTTVGFNLGHLQDMRQKLQNIIDNAPNASTARIVRRMRNELDNAVSDAEGNGQLIGDPQALTDFRTANAATRDKYNFVAPRSNPAAADFMENATRQVDAPGGGRRYAMGGQEAVDHAFGAGNTVTAGGGTGDILTHLHGQLGSDSEALNAARGLVVKRPLYGRAVSPADQGTEIVGGPQYGSTAKRVEAQLRGPGREVTQQLLDPETQLRMGRFKDAIDTLNRSYAPSSPRLNPSGSGYLFSDAGKLPLPKFLTDFAQQYGARRAINTAITGGQRPVFAFPGGPPSPVVGPAARVGGLLGEVYGP